MVLRRIDGRLGNEDRLRALDEFKNDPTVSVLLITMQTGAVGSVKYPQPIGLKLTVKQTHPYSGDTGSYH